VEIFDTSGPADSPPPHQHPWEEIYVVLSGELEVVLGGGEPRTLKAGSVAHVPAGTTHRYRNITECHFLTITTAGNAAIFFKEVSDTVAMSPPDVPAIVQAGNRYGIDFVL
jgi:mannose-6-phosphate isomerase-like protein (cupin superfamily)